jgi:hypothetical protein
MAFYNGNVYSARSSGVSIYNATTGASVSTGGYLTTSALSGIAIVSYYIFISITGTNRVELYNLSIMSKPKYYANVCEEKAAEYSDYENFEVKFG